MKTYFFVSKDKFGGMGEEESQLEGNVGSSLLIFFA
jgi:hypothetical protein